MIKKLFKKVFKFTKNLLFPIRKILGWLFKMPDMPDAAAVMVEKQGSDHPIPVVYGTRKIGVIKVHKYVTDLSGGAENELLHLICVLCEGEIDAIEEVFFDGVSETDARWRKDKNNPNSAKWFTVHKYLGAVNQPASAPAVAAIPNWTSSHTLNGLAYMYIVLQMDKEQSVWRGEPEITARVRGRKIFDPRSNSTAYSENPAIQLLDYLQNPIYGKGINPNRLALPSFIAAANFADQELESAAIINGVITPFTHRRFSSNQVLDTGKSVFSNVQQMLSAMRGSLPIGSGALRLQIERDGDPVFYFSHGRSEQLNHATITGKIRSSGGSKKDRFNRVVVRFPNAALEFERDEVFFPDSQDPLFTEWLAEDNGVLLEQNFEFNTITNKAEALQMARIIALRSRFQLQCNFTASPAAIVVEPGDVVAITDDTRGWDAKPFRVEQVKLKEDGDVDLEFIEHQNAIYPWSGTTYDESIGGTNLGDPTAIQAPTALTLTPDPTLASTGRLTWSVANNAFIRRFRIDVTLDNEVVFNTETQARFCDIPLLAPGSYTATVYAVSTLNTLSPPAALAFSLAIPIPPTDILFTVGNFEIEARPVLANAGLGTQFEFAIGTVDVIRGRGTSMVFTGLSHSTEYTVYARTINALGISAWTDRIATTTADGSNIVDLIGEDIGNQIFDDVVEQVTDNLQTIVDQSVQDLPSVTDVQNVINDALADIDQQIVEDPRVFFVESINNIFDNYETAKEVKNEALQRKVEFDRLDVSLEGAFAEITEAKQVLVDLEQATSESISQVSARIEDEKSAREAAVFTLEQSVVNEGQARALAMQLVNAKIEDETSTREAQVQTIQQSVVEEGQARALAVQNLNASIQQEGTTRTAQVQTLNQAITNESTTRAQAIQTLTVTVNNNNLATIARFDSVESTVNGNTSAIQSIQGQVNNPETGLSATFGLAQSAKTTADNTAQSVTLIQNQVSNPETGLAATAQLAQGANVKADGAVAATAGLTTEISGKVKAMANNGATLVLVGTNTAAYSTNNGASWAQVEIPQGFYTDVVYLSTTDRFYAVGNGVIARSTTNNGSAWEKITIPANIPATWNSVSFISNLFVFIGTNLCVTANQALTTFTERTIPAGAYVKVRGNGNANIAVNNKIVAVGDNVAAVSTNGTSWSNCPIPAGKYVDLAVGMLRWIAVKPNGIAVSTNDAASFTGNLLTSVSQNWKGIISNAVDADRVWLLADSKVFYTNATAIGSNAGWTATTAPVHGDTLTHALMYKAIAINGANITVVGTIGAATSSNTGGSWTRRNLPAALQRVSRAALILDTSETEAGEANSRAFLGVTNIVDGRAVINGITIDGATNALEFRADTLRLSDTNGTVQLYWNTGQNSWVFAGKLIGAGFVGGYVRTAEASHNGVRVELSATGSYPLFVGYGANTSDNYLFRVNTAGLVQMRDAEITGGKIRMIGNAVMMVESATPFGPNNLLEWKGRKVNGVNWNTTTNSVIESGLRKNNAFYYISAEGEFFVGGSFRAGTLSNALSNTAIIPAPTRDMTFSSNGGVIELAASLSYSDTESNNSTLTCPAPLPAAPNATVYLEQLVNGNWQIRSQQTFNGTVECTPGSVQSGEPRVIQRGVGGSVTFTDSSMSTANRTYRVRAVITNHAITANTFQSVSIVSSE